MASQPQQARACRRPPTAATPPPSQRRRPYFLALLALLALGLAAAPAAAAAAMAEARQWPLRSLLRSDVVHELERAIKTPGTDATLTAWLAAKGPVPEQCSVAMARLGAAPTSGALAEASAAGKLWHGDPRRSPHCRAASHIGTDNVTLPVEAELLGLDAVPPSPLLEQTYYFRVKDAKGMLREYVILPKAGSTTLKLHLSKQTLAKGTGSGTPADTLLVFRNPLSRAVAAFGTISARSPPWGRATSAAKARHDFAGFASWLWLAGIGDVRTIFETNQPPPGRTFEYLHQLTSLFFMHLHGGVGGPRHAFVTGTLEHDSVSTYIGDYLGYKQQLDGQVLNAGEGHDVRSLLGDRLPCAVLWVLYAYYRQDFICLGYTFPDECLRPGCRRPTWLPSFP